MIRRFILWISHLWALLCEFIMPSTPVTQTPSPPASQTQLTLVSSSTPTQYDVFLSFRGEDTRLTFTGHLYDKLDSNGISTFKDDPELRSGEVISDALLAAVRNSKAYIVVFSKNYATSPWCLDELAEILSCHKTMQRWVIPVFFNIDPSVVRHQTGSFQKAFKKHKKRFRDGREKLENWQLTLKEVAGFSGHHVSKDRSEADVINEIVDELLLKINPKTLDVAKFPVGLDSRVEAITSLLSIDTKGVIRIGIHGMGGVGKTTLAKAVYNKHYRSFHGSCFLADVREASTRENGLVSLQQKLIDNVLKRKNERIDSVDQGIELIRARICSKKVLIVIDDLDNIMPLEFIVAPFALGSIIIITTRHEDLLDSVRVEARYKVNGLGDAESLQLFMQHAFGDNKIPDTFTELSQEILEHAGGLPLAIKVFGSNLLNQSEEDWRWFINKLKRVPIEDVENKLKISYQALKSVDPMLQNIYLDIVCFFVGRKKKEVVNIMETCYTSVNRHIDILNKRGLLTTNDEDELEMHDLLQDMGRNIARNESPDEPEKHSRLWVSKDICDVLKKEKGTEAVECIIPLDNNRDALKEVSKDTQNLRSLETQLTLVSSSTPTQYDVFLSFRGKDTRLTFTGHLYDKLDTNGISTFKDDPELRSGEVISDALLDAIRNSKTYIVVFSENYATSPWCLNELAEILNCHRTMQRWVIPVFFNIDPSVVRHQTGSFQTAFKKHQKRFRGETEKLENWQLTLKEVADFSGHHISKDRSEADVINEIVDELLLKINPKTLDVAKYPVGLDYHVEAITRMLSSDTKGVIKFGIYGMGGVGKSTLAKALFNQLLRGGRFKGSCFLPNVTEASGTFKGLESLQKKLINDVLKSKNIVEVGSVEEGAKLIKDRICSAKVLVLIDDIYDPEQYEYLAGSFDSGSVVIITTRDEEFLEKVSVEPTYRYMLKELDYAQSYELFTQYAFEKAEPTNNLLALCEDILGLAGGLPLALKIFGSYLSIKTERGWKSYIETLQQYPNSTIEQKLLISLDALELDDRMLKKIFIDIACFFVGWNKEKAVEVLETYYSHADEKIDTLKKRCLLTVNEEKLEMHDLLRDTGRNVARNNALLDEPGKYSRLWLPEDIEDVLKNHKGTEAVEGIIPYNFYHQYVREGKSFTTETFKWMRKLRFLYLEEVNLTGSFEQMFEDLRVLHWESCPLKCLPSEFYPSKLVILELPDSKLRIVWEQNMVSHVFGKLKTLNMSYSEDLVATPDFIRLPSLETLNLKGCESLEEVHMSIGSLERLGSLNLEGCKKLRSLPDTICDLRALKVLNISECNSLEALPLQLGNIKSLTKLSAGELSVSKLPESIGDLNKLVELDLTFSEHLVSIPKLPPNLKWINASFCKSLERLPNLSNSKQLEELNLSFCSRLERLPNISNFQGLENLISIRNLGLEGCSGLTHRHLPKRLFKVYSEFGHQINVHLPKLNLDWIIESPYWTSKSSDSWSTTVYAHLLPNESHNFMGFILCFQRLKYPTMRFGYSVKNTTSGFIWRSDSLSLRDFFFYGSLMVIVPKSIFSVTDDDHRIELTTHGNVKFVGIHLLYNT